MSESDAPPSTIETSANVDDFFRELVTQAACDGGFKASDASTSYVASLLAESARPNPPTLELMGGSSLTLMLAEALESHASERFHRLQRVGDGVLYVSGFFGRNLEHRGIESDYVQGLGATAYARAAAMLHERSDKFAAPNVLRELSDNFEMFVRLVHFVSDELMVSSTHGSGALVDAYERWLKAPSSALTNLLVQSGLIPTRGTQDVN